MTNPKIPYAIVEDFEKRAALEKQLNEVEVDSKEFAKLEEQYTEFLLSKEWSPSVYEEQGKFGVKSVLGSTLVPAAYDEIALRTSLNDEVSEVVVRIGDKWGIVKADGTGAAVLAAEYDEIWLFSSAYTAVRKGNKWGYVASNGNLLTEICYDEIVSILGGNPSIFYDGLSVFRMGDKYGVMNSQGEITAAIFDSISSDGTDTPVTVIQNGKQGYINSEGQFTTDASELYWTA